MFYNNPDKRETGGYGKSVGAGGRQTRQTLGGGGAVLTTANALSLPKRFKGENYGISVM